MPPKTPFHPMPITDYPFSEIESRVKQCPVLLLPVGGLEPIGDNVSLGAVNACCETISVAVSDRMKIFMAPLLPVADTMPFNAFGGSAGVHRRTVGNFVMQCCKTWHFQGFKRIMILTLTMDGSEGVGLAVNRLNAMPGRKGTAGFCFLQSEEMFRTFCGARCKGTEYGRSEWGIRALVSYLHPALYRKNADGRTITVPSTDEYRRWFRRGRDPYKLRKMFPRAILSSCSGTVEAAAGRELFDMTVDLLVAKITRFINQQQQTEAVECPERIKTGKRKRDVSEIK